MMKRVTLNGWKPGLRKVALTKLIEGMTALDLVDAKGCTDKLLEGKKVVIVFDSIEDADAFRQEASELGVITQIEEL